MVISKIATTQQEQGSAPTNHYTWSNWSNQKHVRVHWTKKSMFGLWRFFWILRQTNSVQFNLWTLFLTSVSELWLFPLELNFFVSNRTYFFLIWLGSKEEKNTAFFFSEVWLKKDTKRWRMGPDTVKLCSFASRYYYMCHADMCL